MKTSIQVFGQTDVGMLREGNEDSFLIHRTTSREGSAMSDVRDIPTSSGVVLMVSDGIGGAAAGEVASLLAVETVRDLTRFDLPLDQGSFEKTLLEVLYKANDIICEKASEESEFQGMGATATLAGFLNDMLYVAQVGDSRAYLIRSKSIVQLTKDQTFVRSLVDAGKVTEEEAKTHPRRNILLQALAQKEINVPMVSLRMRRGDMLLLCSDGLSGLVEDTEMLSIVGASPSLADACAALIDMANDRGGPDNITVILARCSGDGFSDPVNGEPIDRDATQGMG